MTYPDKHCPACGRLFAPQRSNQVYCSTKCGRKYRTKKYNSARLKDSKVCKACGKPFTPNALHRVYCSEKCQMKRLVRGLSKGVCPVCGEHFKGNKGKVYCSVECQRAAYNARQRENYAENYAKIKMQKIARKKGETHLNGIVAQARAKGLTYGQLKALQWQQTHKYDFIGGK